MCRIYSTIPQLPSLSVPSFSTERTALKKKKKSLTKISGEGGELFSVEEKVGLIKGALTLTFSLEVVIRRWHQ